MDERVFEVLFKTISGVVESRSRSRPPQPTSTACGNEPSPFFWKRHLSGFVSISSWVRFPISSKQTTWSFGLHFNEWRVTRPTGHHRLMNASTAAA
jgi:hypothetical protein